MDEDLNKDKRSIRLKMIGFYIMILNAIICVSSFAIIVLDLINAVKENPLFVLVLPFAIFMFVGPYIDGIISILLYFSFMKKNKITFLLFILFISILGFGYIFLVRSYFLTGKSAIFYTYITFKMIIIIYMSYYSLWLSKKKSE